jgi:DNA-binding transcriptional ArsR family regulator
MAKEKFILVSLKEDESKKLAQIVSNDTSRKILDYLADKEATESELSEKLEIPISTVHYNLQALVKGKMVEADEYHYSEKGKEVLHYKLANKYIIIAPKSTFGIKEKLKNILPVGLIVLAGSFLVYMFSFTRSMFGAVKGNFVQSSMRISEKKLAPEMMEDAAVESVSAAAEPVRVVAQSGIESFWQTFLQTPALWFLFGAVFTLILLLVVEYIVYLRNKK